METVNSQTSVSHQSAADTENSIGAYRNVPSRRRRRPRKSRPGQRLDLSQPKGSLKSRKLQRSQNTDVPTRKPSVLEFSIDGLYPNDDVIYPAPPDLSHYQISAQRLPADIISPRMRDVDYNRLSSIEEDQSLFSLQKDNKSENSNRTPHILPDEWKHKMYSKGPPNDDVIYPAPPDLSHYQISAQRLPADIISPRMRDVDYNRLSSIEEDQSLFSLQKDNKSENSNRTPHILPDEWGHKMYSKGPPQEPNIRDRLATKSLPYNNEQVHLPLSQRSNLMFLISPPVSHDPSSSTSHDTVEQNTDEVEVPKAEAVSKASKIRPQVVGPLSDTEHKIHSKGLHEVSNKRYRGENQLYRGANEDQNHGLGRIQITKDGIIIDSGSSSRRKAITGEIIYATQADIKGKITISSDTPSLHPVVGKDYISGLAKDLFDKSKPESFDERSMERIYEILPELLESFALKLGHCGSQIDCDIMFFISKHTREIADHFKHIYSIEKEKALKIQGDGSDIMPLEEIMSRWDTEPENLAENTAKPLANSTKPRNQIRDSGHDSSISHIFTQKDRLLKSPAYDWLLATIRNQHFLTSSTPDTMQLIRDRVVKSLPLTSRVPQGRPPATHNTTFVLDWDPHAFIKNQGYKVNPQEAIETAITLTGSTIDAQALTCSQYMRQTWPSTGEYIVQLVKDVVGHEPGTSHSCYLSDKTTLHARIDHSQMIVDVFGTRYSIGEIGEQLAWLIAALSQPQHTAGVYSITPFINEIHHGNTTNSSNRETSFAEISFNIQCKVQQHETRHISSNGQCWHNLFNNPVVVTGYPIPQRPKLDTGLEIPLHMMAGLVQAKKVSLFDGKLFLKGYSTMLVPTNRMDNIIIWHLVYNQDGKYISYLEAPASHANDIGFPQLETRRHILGWCSEVIFFAGASDADYNVKPSLLRSHPQNRIPQKFLHRGQNITGPRFAIGLKDISLRLFRGGGYIDKLNRLHDKFVILWDEEDKRGWLVNGTGALLHLIRSSLDSDSNGECKSQILFKAEHLKEAEQTHRPNSAIQVLKNYDNWKVKIYQDRNDYICLDDRIEEYFDVLFQLFDYRNQPEFQNELKRKYLHGWDFSDLARRQYPVYSRIAQIQPAGKGWIDFTNSLPAITLFGRGFGEIIQPAKPFTCTRWAKLPKEKYYLAISSYDIKNIMRINKETDASIGRSPIRLNSGIIWHCTKEVFDVCQCTEAEHLDFAQTLLPWNFHKKIDQGETDITLRDDSAVIFGHNINTEWRWDDEGAPQKGNHPLSEESDAEFEDGEVDSGTPSYNSQRSRDFELSTSETTPSTTSAKSLRDRYTVGIICALPKELKAVRLLFDKKVGCDKKDVWREIPDKDDNCYVFGRMSDHDIVALCLPSGAYGTNSAASAVSNMRRSFENIAFCLLVGIGGGIPSTQHDIRLGDVVVSNPMGENPGVVQHDFEKITESGEYKKIGSLQRPPDSLLSVISVLESDPELPRDHLLKDIAWIGERQDGYRYPGVSHDKLFAPEYAHDPDQKTCSNCHGPTVNRKDRQVIDKSSGQYQIPKVHYGNIASGNQVIKSAQKRDEINRKCNVLCIEMEAAGIMNIVPCLVIRGICDYADSHKNDEWQEYAAATAAAYAKFLLSEVRPRRGR